MSWRDDLRPASFRGVPFECLSGNRTLGRNVVRHDYPLRDDLTTEDLGRAARSFDVEAIIIGPDYMTGRDALDAALEQPGPGILIHPWHGQKTVTLIEPASSTETTNEGGMIRYQLRFVEEGTTKPPSQTPDTAAGVSTAADTLRATSTDDFAGRFSIDSKPAFVRDAAASVIGKFSDAVDKVTSGLRGYGTPLDDFINDGLALRSQVFDLMLKPADLSASISKLLRGITTLARTPADAAGILSAVTSAGSSTSTAPLTFTSSAGAVTSAQDAVTALQTLMQFGDDLPAVAPTTPSRATQSENQVALVGLIQRLAVAETVEAVSTVTFASYDDAVSTRDDIADQLDVIAVTAADAGQHLPWRAVEDARNAVISDITARGGSLARLYTFIPAVTLPSLVLAYSLYEDTSDIEGRSAEIAARNKIRHPGFVPGGQPLELLSDG